jgi:2-amino-4-hydroxy-6-hydroxymethyldihydropteridine diphosphokinase
MVFMLYSWVLRALTLPYGLCIVESLAKSTPSIVALRISVFAPADTMMTAKYFSGMRGCMEQVFLSLGSNLGDRLAHLRQAIRSVGGFAEITALSDAYETEPVEFTAQPWFMNAVVALRFKDAAGDASSADAPQQLLERLMAIELAMGRRRVPEDFIPKGPRVIDLDIVLYGSRVIRAPALTVPHPAMHLRRFVLQPLAEIAPGVEHPILRQSALQLLQELPEAGPVVRRFAALNWLEE